jgi:metal-dependent hydrolase (beta-lactamase superfamily II)
VHVTFAGAAREVTGSCHLLTVGEHTVALDCGMFQGRRGETRDKNATLPFEPEQLSAVVLSHAHIDHAGRLPLLTRRGYSGTIFATPSTTSRRKTPSFSGVTDVSRSSRSTRPKTCRSSCGRWSPFRTTGRSMSSPA